MLFKNISLHKIQKFVIIHKLLALLLPCILLCSFSFAQNFGTGKDTVIIAGKDYKRSSLYKFFWGKHYRTEWTTPVRVPLFYLDTAAGGLIPYAEGGGRQTKTLRLQNANSKEYVLRSINKTFARAMPEIFQNTFVEDVVNDQVTIAHPYAALTIAPMAAAAKIYHTKPVIVYVPEQKRLDTFNASHGGNLYLFEQRPDENWEEAPNFGASKNIIGTEKLLQHLFADNDHRVDQLAYVKARLFDMFIGDWSRHEDQWRWASFKKDGKTLYQPIPRDRDQAYTLFDGVLVKTILALAGLDYLQSFKSTIDDIGQYNYPARNLDHQLANEPVLQDWVRSAKELQQALTDSVIDNAIHQLPAELFSISGPQIIQKLKARRNHLVKYATQYYKFLATEVEVVGSAAEEVFEIERLNNNETKLTVFKKDKAGIKQTFPFYTRVFKHAETSELRLYGLSGNDVYQLKGKANKGLTVRVVGGPQKDSIQDLSVTSGKRTHIYDNGNNIIETSRSTRLHLSNDSAIHQYRYASFKYDESGIQPSVFYASDDRAFIGLGYKVTDQVWRKEPYGAKHHILARYSFTQKAISFTYRASFTQALGKWNLGVLANYDAIKWTNFFGIGNNTKLTTKYWDFYRMRSREMLLGIDFIRPFGATGRFLFAPLVQRIDIIRDSSRFVAKNFTNIDQRTEPKYFAGALAGISFYKLNDPVVPTKGFGILATTVYTHNFTDKARNVTRFTGTFNFYVPILKNLVLAVQLGGATLTGNPEFYQLNAVGGSNTIRGYRSDRFAGTTTVFNSNELQWIFNVKSYLFNGKAGLIGFYDQGRVWQKGETSNKLHSGYGGGFMIAPFNKAMISVTYGISPETSLFHLRLNRSL